MWRQRVTAPLSYVRRHITVNEMLSASLNKTFPFFFFFFSIIVFCTSVFIVFHFVVYFFLLLLLFFIYFFFFFWGGGCFVFIFVCLLFSS